MKIWNDFNGHGSSRTKTKTKTSASCVTHCNLVSGESSVKEFPNGNEAAPLSVLWLRARVAGGGDEGDVCSSSLVRRQERDRRREWRGPCEFQRDCSGFGSDPVWGCLLLIKHLARLKSACARTDADVQAQPVSATHSSPLTAGLNMWCHGQACCFCSTVGE